MKMTQDILGLPIISISTGEEVGKVKNILINGDRGAIDYIVVDTGNQIYSARVIPTKRVLGIGENALTIENESSISDISKVSEAVELIQKEIKVKGAKVLTKKGNLIGEIGDICIDEDNFCRITALEHITDISHGKSRLIPREKVITFGRNLVIVENDFQNFLLDNIEGISISSDQEKNDVTNAQIPYVFDDAETHSENGFAHLIQEQENEEVQEEIPEQPVLEQSTKELENEKDEAVNLFEQRQRQYLIGRRATKTITDKNGNVIVNEGMIINDEIINEAKKNDKIIELVMNNEG
ncbi:MAG: PRC-barrel domain-containing protein [Acetivibrionales bacterium]|jgi:uncharacterized protein YrrD